MDKSVFKPVEEKMSKGINSLLENFKTVKVGKANPAILDRVMVDYYGVPTKINQLGNISVPEAKILMIQPWDTSILKDIEKAIQIADIGINPNNDGTSIRLVFPELTEERRKEIVKTVKKKGEESKVVIRTIRRDAIDEFKAQKKNSLISEDDLKYAEDEIQKLTDKFVKEIDEIVESKEKEILKV